MLNLDEINGKSLDVQLNKKTIKIKEPSIKAVFLINQIEKAKDDEEAFNSMLSLFKELGMEEEEFKSLTISQLNALMEAIKENFLQGSK